MSDEAAFLEALKANPADDTARLVYADWLDERDRPAHAAYLRAVVDLTRLRGGTPEYTAAADRLYAASSKIAPDWSHVAGARFDVILDGYEPTAKIPAIKVVRERTGLGLVQAKALAESVPVSLHSWLTFEVALSHLVAFHWFGSDTGARYPIRASIRPTPWPETVPGMWFDVYLDAIASDPDFDADYPPRAMIGLALILGVTTDEARERAEKLPLILATDLAPASVAGFVRNVKSQMNFYRALPPHAIRLVPRPPKE